MADPMNALSDVLNYPQVIVVLDDMNENAVADLKKMMVEGRAEVDVDKLKGGIMIDGQIHAFPGIYNPITHYFTLPKKDELRDFARIVSAASKSWPEQSFFMAVNGAGEGQNQEITPQCLLMIMEQDDVETVEGGCPPNGLYVVVKDGAVTTSSDKLYGGSPDEVAYFSEWLFLAS